jgi:hypothetical protein
MLQPADVYDIPRHRQLAGLQVQVTPAQRAHLAGPKPDGGAQPQEQAEGRVLLLGGGQGLADLGRGRNRTLYRARRPAAGGLASRAGLKPIHP